MFFSLGCIFFKIQEARKSFFVTFELLSCGGRILLYSTTRRNKLIISITISDNRNILI